MKTVPASDLTPKREAFVIAFHELGNQAEAYRRAYCAKNMSDNAIYVEACRLLQDPRVALRLQELQKQGEEQHQVTVGSITDMLTKAYEKGEGDPKGASAMVTAAMGLAKLHGHIVDKKEVTRKNEKSDLSDDELADIVRRSRTGDAGQTASTAPTDRLH